MQKWMVIPTISVNGIPFLSSREEVRERLGMAYQEIKKSTMAQNTTDVYDGFHVFYDEENRFCAIEVFGGLKLSISGKTVFPGTISKAKKVLSDLEYDGYGYTSVALSVGITVNPDEENQIDGILFGCKDYYKE